MKEELILLKDNDVASIALWKSSPKKPKNEKHVLLAHGTFSNKNILKGIKAYLVERGFTCWVFEWRNHGASETSDNKITYETIGKKDYKIVFDYLLDECGIDKLHCVAHSAGGIALTIALVNYPQLQKRINSISLFATQSFKAASSVTNYFKIFIGKYLNKLLGYTPAGSIGGEEDESYYLMKEWFEWNTKGEFIGTSGTDYKKEMRKIKTPILALFGTGDHFIAPPSGCEAFLNAFENPSNKSMLCGKSTGYAENYNHGRIILSSNAKKELYPLVLNWMNKYV